MKKSNGLLAQALAISLGAFLVTSPLVAKEKPEWFEAEIDVLQANRKR